jgi:hypothetical protein
MDVIDEYSDKLGERLAMLMRPLIDQDLSVVFYDLTTVALTGQTDLEGDVRAYGMAKSGLVERQFMLSLVQTAEGLPIAHEVHTWGGAPMKGETMLATMQRPGVAPNRSRPSVSNDNPYSESLFRTLKYRPAMPVKPFECLL